MTAGKLILRSLRFHWRSHLGVLVGATLAAAILVGALAVGDCVRYSLREMALARLGRVHLALHGRDRFFRQELAAEVAGELQAPVEPAILLAGAAAAPGGEARANRVQVAGVRAGFWTMSSGGAPPGASSAWSGDQVILNERLAAKLKARPGDEVILRIEKPSLLSRDAPLSTIQDATTTLRVKVAAVANDRQFGRFGLEANQIPPYNAFVPLELLQAQIDLGGRANTLLVGGPEAGPPAAPAAANAALARRWRLADAALRIEERSATAELELRTDRIFLEPAIGAALRNSAPGGRGILTYFVNELRAGERSTPYSTVAAVEGSPLPPSLQDDEAVIHPWLAEDLGVRAGDRLTLKYFVVGPLRQLEEKSAGFRIKAVLPPGGPAADPTLMPDFPGVAEADNCRDWEPGIRVDLSRIRDKDEAYWDRYRGTPKVFLTLKAGQALWNNRFGNLTAVRYPTGVQSRDGLEACLRQALSPAAIGLFVVPVREQALAAGAASMDFGQLFVGFSLFLIVAALLLMALLFTLGVEQRAEEVGALLAVGFPLRRVQRLLLLEGGALALLGTLVGTALAAGYTRLVLAGLSTVWKDAVT
ncbi:MAG: FtsX-like permease family protein, partial [Armatimonadetes bacterium]|nr:FtsX-like permease family protein [Armatimonadota bacterium]